MKWDVCVIGSGAGAGPVIYALSKAGYSVLVLEKGPWYRTADFAKDELVAVRRSVYTSSLIEEPQVLEWEEEGRWTSASTFDTGDDFWNGNCVGGSSNFMSGYFLRFKPMDFQLLSTYGEIAGANIVDWPISYEDLEPYYTRIEHLVGISGRVVSHRYAEPRSTPQYPYPPLRENVVSGYIDKACAELGYEVIPTPRAILSKKVGERDSCYYSGYCGSYGCNSDAKGSSRVAFIHPALATGHCAVLPNAKVYALETDGRRRVKRAWYYDVHGAKQYVEARVFVVAAQAVETCRLLLMSRNDEFPNGLANNNGQVGKNLIFSAGGTGGALFYLDEWPEEIAQQIRQPGYFINRTVQHFYEIEDPKTGKRIKGGSIDFLFEHNNATTRAIHRKWTDEGSLRTGRAFKEDLKVYFTDRRQLKFEVFVDWLPHDNCFVGLSETVRDKWGDPVAKIRIGHHPHDVEVAEVLVERAKEILRQMGLREVYGSVSTFPPSNLQAGGCRFGSDPKTSVLDPSCRAHEVDNLYVTDGSFLPNAGSVPLTWTIYANALRVAEIIKKRL